MSLTPIKCEVRLVGLSKQRRKDGDWTEVKFHIQPNETPHALFILPLGTHCELSIKGVDGDDVPAETGSEPTPAPLKGGPKSIAAGRLCAKRDFQNWYLNAALADPNAFPDDWSDESVAAELVRAECNVRSRAELDDPNNPEPGRVWDRIESEYRASQRGDTDEARLAQRADGPS